MLQEILIDDYQKKQTRTAKKEEPIDMPRNQKLQVYNDKTEQVGTLLSFLWTKETTF